MSGLVHTRRGKVVVSPALPRVSREQRRAVALAVEAELDFLRSELAADGGAHRISLLRRLGGEAQDGMFALVEREKLLGSVSPESIPALSTVSQVIGMAIVEEVLSTADEL